VKTLGASLLITCAVGLVVAGGALVLGLEPAVFTAALLGSGVSTLLGALALVIKVASPLAGGTGGLRALLSRQVLALFLRLGAVLLGAVALRENGAASVAFVMTFFIAYLGQQVVEVRSLLAVRQGAAKSEVTP
jgi:hypothetical protein